MKQTEHLSKSIKDVGVKMSAMITAPLAAAGTFSLISAGKFDKSMRDVQSTTRASSEEMAGLRDMAKSLSGMGVGPDEAAEGLKALGRVGLSAKESMAALEPFMQAVGQSGLEVGDMANVTDSLLDAFGNKAQDLGGIMGKMTFTAAKAGMGFKDMADVIISTAPVFNDLGMNLDDTMVLLRGMDSAHIDAKNGAAKLSKELAALVNPSKAMVDAFANIGIHEKDLFTKDKKFKGMINLFEQLQKHGAKSADTFAIFGNKAGPMMDQLLQQGVGTLQQYQSELKDTSKTLEDLDKSQMQGAAGALKQFTASIQNIALQIGEKLVPVMLKLWSAVEPLLQAFAKLPDGVLTTTIAFLALAAAAGPILVIASEIISAWGTVAAAIGEAGGVIAILSNPVGWAIGAFFALSAIFIALGDTIKPLKDMIGTGLQVAFAGISAILSTVWPIFQSLWDTFKNLVTILQPFLMLALGLGAVLGLIVLAPLIVMFEALVYVLRFLAWILKEATQGWVLIFKVVGDFFAMIDKAMGGPMKNMIASLSELLKNLTGGGTKKVEVTHKGEEAPGVTPGGLPFPKFGGGVTPAAAAGTAAGMSAMGITGPVAEPQKVTVHFDNLPPGSTVTATPGIIVSGYHGPIMAGV